MTDSTKDADRSQPRVLHIGNILNNGYLNCKFLRRRGIEADSLNVDYRHVQGQPEWEEVYLDQAVDEFNPDWDGVDLKGFQRPPWFFDVWLAELPALAARLEASSGRTSPRHTDKAETGPLPDKPNNIFHKIARKIGLWQAVERRRARKSPVQTEPDGEIKTRDHYWAELMDRFRAAYPEREQALSLDDILALYERSRYYSDLLELYPLIQGYGLDPIHALLGAPGKPFICFEHGTLREFPFEDSPRGRLYALCVKKAEKVIITNADCNRAADRLGLDNYVFIPHPVDEELYHPQESALAARLKAEHDCDWVFLAPARHHWKNCPDGLENSWFKRNDILIRGLGHVFRRRPDLRAVVIFFEWGQEVDLSKELIRECGFSDRVRWEPLRTKPVLKEFYDAADIVFDQFNDGIGTFGTVVPEALACSKPVVLNYKAELHRWCYPELPPLLNAPDEEAVARHAIELLDNETYRLELGRRGRRWFLDHHSSSVVADRMIAVYREIADRHGWGWRL